MNTELVRFRLVTFKMCDLYKLILLVIMFTSFACSKKNAMPEKSAMAVNFLKADELEFVLNDNVLKIDSRNSLAFEKIIFLILLILQHKMHEIILKK